MLFQACMRSIHAKNRAACRIDRDIPVVFNLPVRWDHSLSEQSKDRYWFLYISDATVKMHITHILKKLKVTAPRRLM
jgi:hypothetical protein